MHGAFRFVSLLILFGFGCVGEDQIVATPQERAGCEASCRLLLECGFGQPDAVADCADACSSAVRSAPIECRNATAALGTCAGGRDCDDFESGSCETQFEAVSEECQSFDAGPDVPADTPVDGGDGATDALTGCARFEYVVSGEACPNGGACPEVECDCEPVNALLVICTFDGCITDANCDVICSESFFDRFDCSDTYTIRRRDGGVDADTGMDTAQDTAPPCPTGFGDCDSNPENGCETQLNTLDDCGGCNVSCSPVRGTGTCATGTCVVESCEANYGDCDLSASNGCETRIDTDENHCGACGNPCADHPNTVATCTAGGCSFLCQSGFNDCNSTLTDGCEAELAIDALNCGMCGQSCTSAPANASASCVASDCAWQCTGLWRDCNGLEADGCEVDGRDDVNNCGNCGNVCPARVFGDPTCTAGGCDVICVTAHGNCDGDPTNGCEIDLTSSPDHCNACGNACPGRANSTRACAAPDCGFTCTEPYRDCNSVDGDGCETNRLTDPANCGTCGMTCPSRDFAAAACTDGDCDITCQSGRGDCNGVITDGCEIDTNTDVSHCGGCNSPCPTPPGTMATCTAGSCGTVCLADRADCNGIASDGCEANLLTDPDHCGGCGNTCPSRDHATRTCTAPACGYSCSYPYLDCNGIASDGCEVNKTNDDDHCGACNDPCNGARICCSNSCVMASVCGG